MSKITTLYIKGTNGECVKEYLFKDSDFLRVVDQYLGREAYLYLKRIIDERDRYFEMSESAHTYEEGYEDGYSDGQNTVGAEVYNIGWEDGYQKGYVDSLKDQGEVHE